MRQSVIDIISAATGAAAIVGGVLYATIWWGYSAFYSRLGLQPSDVGLTQGDIIRTTALGLGSFAMVVIPAAALWWFLISGALTALRLLRGGGSDRHRHGLADRLVHRDTPALRATLTCLAVLGCAPLIALGQADYIFSVPFGWYFVGGDLALVAAVVYSGLIQGRAWALTPSSLIAWAGAVGVVFYCSVAFLTIRGDDLAGNVIYGSAPYDSTFLFDVRRDLVCVTSAGRSRAMVFLGESVGGVVLFDPAARSVVRPTARPTLTFDTTRATSCGSQASG